MSSAGFCMYDSGIIGTDDKLTKLAKDNFIKEMKDELRVGTANMPAPALPCGPAIPPFPFVDLLPLEDEKKFPELHKNIFGQYEQIAKALDSQSRFTLLPICCPAALATQLGADPPKLKFPSEFLVYGFSPPLLAIKLQFKLPTDLLAKLPPLISPPIPSMKLPTISIDPKKFPELLSFSSGIAGVPPKLVNVILEMVKQMPQLATGILSGQLKPFCDVVLKSKMFGDFDASKSTTWVVAQKVLARKTAECCLLNVVGTTLGSSAGGIVGGLSSLLGYNPPATKFAAPTNPVDKIVEAALTGAGKSWSSDQAALQTTPIEKLQLPYSTLLLPIELGDGKGSKPIDTHRLTKSLNCGTLLARACLLHAGLTDDFFVKSYEESGAAARLRSLMVSRQIIATSDYTLQKGDIVVLTNDASAIVIEDFKSSKGDVVRSRIDVDNGGLMTSIEKINAEITNSTLRVGSDSWQISYVIQGKKLVE